MNTEITQKLANKPGVLLSCIMVEKQWECEESRKKAYTGGRKGGRVIIRALITTLRHATHTLPLGGIPLKCQLPDCRDS